MSETEPCAPKAGVEQEQGTPSRLEELASRVVLAFNELQREAWTECGEARAKPNPTRFEIPLSTALTPGELADLALQKASECLAELEIVRSGHVYCYACGNSICEHSTPPAAGAVFAGYASTGRPRWQEFFNALLELGDIRAEWLFGNPPRIVSRVMGRRRLIEDQLATFGKNSLTYRIWGQVIAGYISVDGLRAALTAQFVEDRRHRLGIHVLTPVPLLEAMANSPENRRSAFHRIHDALEEARRQTRSLTAPWSGARTNRARGEIRDRAFGILRHLAHSIEKKDRQQRRRTVHAETRAGQRRPVHKAHDDLTAATPADLFADRFKHSVIVVGKAGRVHAFNGAGKHITSLVLHKDELDRRLARKRYVPLEPELCVSFLQNALATMPADGPGNGQPKRPGKKQPPPPDRKPSGADGRQTPASPSAGGGNSPEANIAPPQTS